MDVGIIVSNDLKASDLLLQKKFHGRTKIQGDIPNNSRIIVINGRLDIEGDIGDNVNIELKSANDSMMV